jgi:uncharacterized protein YggE
MKLHFMGGLAVAVLAGATPAAAQDLSGFAGILATATEGYAQAFGEAVVNGQSVFVTAHGKAKLPAPLTGSYFVNVDGKSASAVEAARQRDGKLGQLRAVAQQFGVQMELGDSRFALETDSEAQQRRTREIIAERTAHPELKAPLAFPSVGDAPKIFVARTGVRFKEPPAARLAAFLDAIRASGVDDIRTSLTAASPGLFGINPSSEVLGFGSVETIDDAVWNAAGADAISNARNQAQTLAAAAGRNVGEARQILLLAKAIQDGEAVVTVAVRFGFAPKS